MGGSSTWPFWGVPTMHGLSFFFHCAGEQKQAVPSGLIEDLTCANHVEVLTVRLVFLRMSIINVLRGLPCRSESLRLKFTNKPSILVDGDLAEFESAEFLIGKTNSCRRFESGLFQGFLQDIWLLGIQICQDTLIMSYYVVPRPTLLISKRAVVGDSACGPQCPLLILTSSFNPLQCTFNVAICFCVVSLC